MTPALAALFAILSSPATAQVTLSGSFRSRAEAWNWYSDADASSYLFSGNLLRLAVSGRHTGWDWQVEFAVPVLLGLPDDAVRPAPQLQLGFGGNYFAANNASRNAVNAFPKQAFLRFNGLFAKNDSLRLGRFEFIDGAETTPANATLAALKRDRIAHRLIGNFGFSHVGRSLDAGQYAWTSGGWNVTALGGVPTRGVFQVNGWGDMPIALVYGAVTRALASKRHDAEWRLFGIYYGDTRNIVKSDNRPALLRAADFEDVRIGTFGGHFILAARRAAGTFDALLWGAAQAGKWGRLDHRGWAFAIEGGWQPGGTPPLRPWLRGGYTQSSGDGDPLDGKHDTFFQILPTPRVYARFPFFNLMNIRDAFGSLTLRPERRLTVRTDVHGLWLANRNDSWYQGGGAFQPWTFGYTARPSFGGRSLATLWDASADWQVNPHASVGGYIAHAWGHEVIRAIYPSDPNALLGYVELTLRF